MSQTNREQERKFLLPLDFPVHHILPKDVRVVRLEQPYIGSPLLATPAAPRLRIIEGSSVVEMTSKTGHGQVREEATENFDGDAMRKLKPFFNLPLSKTRYFYKKTAEFEMVIDVFNEGYRGICVMEVEWKGDAQPELPDWLSEMLASGQAVEVTGRWSNVDLARLDWAAELSTPEHVWEYLALAPIPMIAFEGGPVSGKDSILEEFANLYKDDCYVIPEVATSMILTHGKHLPKENRFIWNGYLQGPVCVTQTLQEQWAQIIARRAGHKVIFVNRGRFGQSVFIDGGIDTLLRLTGLNLEQEAGRYAKIIQLAVAPEEIYDEHVVRNRSRTESHAQAVAQEQQLRQLFGACSNYSYVANRQGGMASKVSDVLELIREIVPGFAQGVSTAS
jgi:CYTH domain-containing protein